MYFDLFLQVASGIALRYSVSVAEGILREVEVEHCQGQFPTRGIELRFTLEDENNRFRASESALYPLVPQVRDQD